MWGEETTQTGHRQRLRVRFLRSGLEGFQDYEALELLLTFAIPRKDVKPLAKRLIERFGSLSGVMSAPVPEIQKTLGAGPAAAILLHLCREIVTKALEESVTADKRYLNSSEEAAGFIKMKIGTARKETLMVLFLNSRRAIIEYKLYFGTVDRAAVYPREILEEALLCHASSVILAHNHPSEICYPSEEDLLLTDELQDTLSRMGIELLDHLIVSGNSHVSIIRRRRASLPLAHTAGDSLEQPPYRRTSTARDTAAEKN